MESPNHVVDLRVETIRPDDSFHAVFCLLTRHEVVTRFRAVLEAVIGAWGGFVGPGNDAVVVNSAGRGDVADQRDSEALATTNSLGWLTPRCAAMPLDSRDIPLLCRPQV